VSEIIDIFSRAQAIACIEDTYPADSNEPATRQTGRDLLARAIEEQHCAQWRHEGDGVLFRYAELCRNEQRRRAANARRLRESLTCCLSGF